MEAMDAISPRVHRDIGARITILRQEITKLEAKIKEHQADVASWEKVLTLIRADSSQHEEVISSDRFSGMKAVDAVEVLLKEQGVPLYIGDLLLALRANGWPTNAKEPERNLVNIIQRDDRFVKTPAKMWDLKERHQEKEKGSQSSTDFEETWLNSLHETRTGEAKEP